MRLAGRWPPDQELALNLLTPGAYLGPLLPASIRAGRGAKRPGAGLPRPWSRRCGLSGRVSNLTLEGFRAGMLPAKGGATWTERWYRIGNENDMDLSALSRRLW